LKLAPPLKATAARGQRWRTKPAFSAGWLLAGGYGERSFDGTSSSLNKAFIEGKLDRDHFSDTVEN